MLTQIRNRITNTNPNSTTPPPVLSQSRSTGCPRLSSISTSTTTKTKMVFDRRSISKSTKSSYQHNPHHSHPHNRTSSISRSSSSRDHVTSSLYGQTRLLSLINVVLCILLLNCFAISPSLQEAFDISKLEEYNSLANCIGQIHKDFEQCNTKGAEKAKGYISTVELGEEWSKRLKCCGMWKLRDCWMKAARTKCTKAQAEQVFKLPQLFMPTLVTECADYTPESGKCTVPMWLIASVVSGIVFLVGTCLCGTIYCIRRARQSRTRRKRTHNRHRRSTGGSTAISGTQTTQLMHSMANGKANHTYAETNGGAAKKPHSNGKIPVNGQVYMNGTAAKMAPNPTIKIDIDPDDEERKSLNGPSKIPPV